MLDAAAEESVLLAHDLARHLENRLRALVQRFDQPVCRLEFFGDEFALGLGQLLPADPRVVALIDQHARQRVRVELDQPPAAGRATQQDVGDHRGRRALIEDLARLRIERLHLGDHVGEVGAVDAAKPRKRREFTPRQEIEMLDHLRHRRIEAVALAQLDRQALPEAAGKHARRIELLEPLEHGVDPRRRTVQRVRDAREIGRQIPGRVKLIDQVNGDDAVGGIADIDVDLLEQVFAQRLRPARRHAMSAIGPGKVGPSAAAPRGSRADVPIVALGLDASLACRHGTALPGAIVGHRIEQ